MAGLRGWLLAALAVALPCAALAGGRGARGLAGSVSRMEDRLRLNYNFYLQDACRSEECVQRARTLLAARRCGDLADPDTSIYLRHAHFIEARCSSAKSGAHPGAAVEKILAEYPGLFISVEKNFPCEVRGEAPEKASSSHSSSLQATRQLLGRSSQTSPASAAVRDVQTFSNVYDYWNLDRLDQIEGGFEKSTSTWRLDKVFDFSCFPKQGKGATIYVIDTGCNTEHEDLRGRTEAYADPRRFSSANDDNGHGTHVAAVAGGTFSGVCKQCAIVCVKAVASSGVGSSSDIVGAIDWVIERHSATSSESPDSHHPAVAVLSVGAKGSAVTLDEGVQRLSQSGIIPVVAAANYGANGCDFTPARSPFAVTVGATDLSDHLVRDSNWGSCVNAMAPGYSVKSAGKDGTLSYDTRTGTSQAAPAMAGVLGLILAEQPMAQSEAVALALRNGKVIRSGIPGHNFTYPMVHVSRDHCEDYGFPVEEEEKAEYSTAGCGYHDDFGDIWGEDERNNCESWR